MIIRKYELFKESNDSKIKVGDLTNKGRVLWMDTPYNEPDGKEADFLVKTDMFNKELSQNFSWFRISELELLPKEEGEVKLPDSDVPVAVDSFKSEIDFTELMKCDIRICNVLTAERVKGKDRLLLLTINTGIDERQVVTNLGGTYTPEDLQGKNYPFVLNLKPAKIAKIDSFGMIIAAESDGKQYLIESNAPVGSKVI